MKRSEALKKLGLTFGLIAGGPSLLSVMQGCKRTTINGDWEPMFFSIEQANLITETVDVIIPASDVAPAASEVGVPQFIDQFVNEVVSVEEQGLIKDYMSHYEKLAARSGVPKIVEQTFSKTEEEQAEIYRKIDSYAEALKQEQQGSLDDESAVFAFLNNLRGLTIMSYKNSETVGENILAYEPVPGRQQGCVDLQETTGGKAWALT